MRLLPPFKPAPRRHSAARALIGELLFLLALGLVMFGLINAARGGKCEDGCKAAREACMDSGVPEKYCNSERDACLEQCRKKIAGASTDGCGKPPRPCQPKPREPAPQPAPKPNVA